MQDTLNKNEKYCLKKPKNDEDEHMIFNQYEYKNKVQNKQWQKNLIKTKTPGELTKKLQRKSFTVYRKFLQKSLCVNRK